MAVVDFAGEPVCYMKGARKPIAEGPVAVVGVVFSDVQQRPKLLASVVISSPHRSLNKNGHPQPIRSSHSAERSSEHLRDS